MKAHLMTVIAILFLGTASNAIFASDAAKREIPQESPKNKVLEALVQASDTAISQIEALENPTEEEVLKLVEDYYNGLPEYRPEDVQIMGKVVAENGEPVSGIMVEALPWPVPESGEMYRRYPGATARTDSEGKFLLTGLRPAPVEEVTGWLSGGEPQHSPLYVKLIAGNVEGWPAVKASPTLPLVTEEVAMAARQLLKVKHAAARKLNYPEEDIDSETTREIPESSGNLFFNIELVYTQEK